MTENNPAEELNRFPEATAGSRTYPYCWTEWPPDRANVPKSTPSVGNTVGVAVLLLLACDGRTVGPSGLVLQLWRCKLQLPLVYFYQWTEQRVVPSLRQCDCLPQAMDGFAFIAFHGS
jgi:hypothetical protein